MKLEELDYVKFLEVYGNVYVNFISINDCNEKLKFFMIEKCIKKNGIDVKIGVVLVFVGKVIMIYKND